MSKSELRSERGGAPAKGSLEPLRESLPLSDGLPLSDKEEHDLVRAAQGGDVLALSLLMDRLAPWLARICGGIALEQADDAAQEALLQVFRDLSTLREPAALRGWARRIAVREAVRHAQRARQERGRAGGDDVAETAAHSDGRAIDPGAPSGTGVDAIHVWAYPRAGGDPMFVGEASIGGARPDVAAVYGDRFLNSGYGLKVRGLDPGTYDLAVFAWSTAKRGWLPAKVVAIDVK